jgi:two-component system chemotaxis sensor kinase CheA
MTNPQTTLRDEFACLDDDWESAERYLSIFIDECQQTLDELTEALLALEAGGGKENVEQLFVAAHRIKGSASSIGLNRPAKLAHLMEDILQILVQNDCTLASNVADRMLACTDGLRQYVDAVRDGRHENDQFAELAQQLLDAQRECDAILHPNATEAKPQETSVLAEERKEDIAAKDDSAQRAACMANLDGGISPELHRRVAAALREEDQDGTILVGQVVFEPNLPLVGLKAQLIYSKLSNLGDIRYADPPVVDVESLDEIASLHFGVATDKNPEDVQRWLHVAGTQQIHVEPLIRRQSNAKSPAAKATTSEPSIKPAETLRVEVERLDRLMNLAGQLAIGKARVSQIADSLKAAMVHGKSVQCMDRIVNELKRMADRTASGSNVSNRHVEMEELKSATKRLEDCLHAVHQELASFSKARVCVNNLLETIHLLDSVSDGLRQNVMDMRMLPIGPLFNRFHRVIRDITRGNGKDVHLLIDGEKTQLDKRMIDELGDPMIHLVRNAADHGIESPEDREAAGKPRQGTISLDAFHRGSSIVIRVSDDGKGLDPERIRAKALAKGLITAADAETMTTQQIYQLIWLPGLSTAEKVTDVSGRGVGMDIVRSKVKELNGTVDVDSEPGRGTTFSIRLPLTLAILPSLMVEVDKDVFAIPLESVIEIVRVSRRNMATVHGHWTVPLRDRVVGVLTLGALFRWNHRNGDKQIGESDDTMLVIVGEGERQVGLAVDRVLGEEDVVIKSIADNYRNVGGVSGASILGDGRISLILDPPALIEMASRPVLTTGKI